LQWYLGFHKQSLTPAGRGSTSSLGFLGGGEDHFNQCNSCGNAGPSDNAPGGGGEFAPAGYRNASLPCEAAIGGFVNPCNISSCPRDGGVDLYRTDGPALGLNGTWNGEIFASEAVRAIHSADISRPIYLYAALHDVHQPVEAPLSWIEKVGALDLELDASPLPRELCLSI